MNIIVPVNFKMIQFFVLIPSCCFDRVFSLIDENTSPVAIENSTAAIVDNIHTEVPFAATTVSPNNTNSKNNSKNNIEFMNVSFAYKTRADASILTNFNLTIELNKITCITGKSGSGKTSILSLLSG